MKTSRDKVTRLPEEAQIRRRFYLIAMALGLASAALPTLLGDFAWFGSPYETLVPLTLGATAFLALLLWIRPGSLQAVEVGVFGVIVTYNLSVLALVFYLHPNPYAEEYIYAYKMFSPLLYMWAFLTFGRRDGLLASLLFVMSAFLLAAPYLLRLVPTQVDHEGVIFFFLVTSAVSSVYTAMLYALAYFLEASNQAHARAEVLAELAYTDPLTGLPNRLCFDAHLVQAVDAARTGSSFALAFIDLDDFKRVNDTLGHQAGDVLLKAVAARLQEPLRTSDLLARVSGDEFALILPGVETAAEVKRVAAKLLGALETPFDLGEACHQASISIGFALCTQQAATPETLLVQADQAMYAVKRRGKGGFHLGSLREETTVTAVYLDTPPA